LLLFTDEEATPIVVVVVVAQQHGSQHTKQPSALRDIYLSEEDDSYNLHTCRISHAKTPRPFELAKTKMRVVNSTTS